MNKVFYTILAVFIFININVSYAQSSKIIEKIAGTSNDFGRSMGFDSSGNLYVLGDYSSSTLSFNNGITLSGDGSGDLFLAKYNSNGVCQWAQRITGPGADIASKLVVDNIGNIYFTGYSSSSYVNFNNGYSITNSGSNDAFVAKYNTIGQCQWAHKIAGTNSDYAYGIDLDNSGNIYISGNYSSSIINFNNGIALSNSGSLDIFIAKYNNNGLCQWAQKIYGSSAEYAYSVALDNNNNLFITGHYNSSTLNFNNGIALSNSGSSDVFITKYSESGICQWAKKVYGTSVDEAFGLDIDSKGNAYFAGSFTSATLTFDSFTTLNIFAQRDIFLTKIDNNGNFKWANRIYGNSNDYANIVLLDKKDNIWLGGYYTSDSLIFSGSIKLNAIIGTDAFVSRIDSNGVAKSISRIYGNSSDYIESIVNNKLDSVFVSGYFNSSKLYVNNDSLSQSGLNDAFIASVGGSSGGSGGGGGGDDDGGTEEGNLTNLITPINGQIGVSVRPIFSSKTSNNFIVYLSTDSNFVADVDTLTSDGYYLYLSNNLKFNTKYYAKSNNTISFTTQIFRKDLMWNWSNSYPQGNDLNVVKMYSADNIMALGDLMTIINSSNGGSNWKVQKTVVINNINSAFFSPFEDVIVAAANNGTIYKSTDKGDNWTEINLNIKSDINQIVFADKNAGWLVANGGLIYKSTNGGNSWVAQNSKVINNLSGLAFPNLNVGYVVGDNGKLLKTTNGGSVWSELTSPTTKNLIGVTFMNLYKGFIYGNDGVLYKTTNGGTSWSQVNLNTANKLHDLKFVNSLVGMIVADSGLVYKTTDGGNTWNKKYIPDTLDLFSISFLSSNTAIVCGEKGVMQKTTDGGESWDNLLVDRLGYVSLNSVNFVNSNDGYIDLSPDTLYLKTTNGGKNWFYQSIGDSVNKVFFINGSIGWAVGDSGKILKTINAGSTWNWIESNTTVDLVNLSFIDEYNGWCTGDNGYLLVSTDGGLNWLSQNVGSDNNYLQVLFTDANNGWVITDGAEILKTTDGGANWNFQSNPLEKNLEKLFFWDNQNGWGIYGDNQIIKTTNGGNEWELINTGYTNIKDIYFVDNNHGWAAGDNIVHSSDGGSTWVHQDLATTNRMNGLYFHNYNHGWAVGEDGTILEFDNTDFVILPPSLILPSNHSSNVTLIPKFEWSAPDRATHYDIEVALNNDFVNQIVYQNTIDINEDKIVIGEKLNTNTKYFWRIQAYNNLTGERSFWSSTFNFTTQDKLVKPILYTPNDGKIKEIHKPTFTWNAIQFAESYVIQISEDTYFFPNNTVSTTVNTNSFTPANYLKQSTNYYWRVKAINDANESEWADEFTFTTDLLAIPPKTILKDYTNNSIDVPKSGRLEWFPTSQAVRYRLVISKDPQFIQDIILDEDQITNTYYNYPDLEISTDYYWKVIAYNWLGDAGPVSDVWKFKTITYELVPDFWSYVPTTGKDATILLPLASNPTIDNRSFQKGDALGIFYTDGNIQKCAGYGIWNNSNLVITVWGDNDQTTEKDGFLNNENYIFKIWDGQKGQEVYAKITIQSGSITFSDGNFTTIATMKGISPSYHSNYLLQGWNLISSYVEPENLNMSAIFDVIKDKVVIVKNKNGLVYIPAYNINSIGNWNYKEAYQIYTNSSTSFTIKGIELLPQNESIVYNSIGWQFAAFLMNKNYSAVDALKSLTNSNKLLICKDNIGQVYIPQYNINTIGNMLVGQGYKLYVSSAPATLTYPINPPAKGNKNGLTPTPKYLLPEYEKTGNYSVLILKLDSKNYNEVGVYNNNNVLIGSGVVYNNLASVVIWGDNEQTDFIDGALENEKLKFKLFEVDNGKYRDLNIHNSMDMISKSRIHDYSFNTNSVILSEAIINDNVNEISVFPMPAKDILNIMSNTGIDLVQIFDLQGKLIKSVELSKAFNEKSVQLELNGLPNGEYSIKIMSDGKYIIKKFVVLK